MAKIGATWAALSVLWFDDPKMVRAGRDGRDLWLSALLWSAALETDGLIPTEMLPGLALRAGVEQVTPAVERLVALGAWHVVEGGWTIHAYETWQPSAAQRRAQRAAAAERSRRWREARTATESAGQRDASRDALVTRDAPVTATRTRRVSSPRDGDGDGELLPPYPPPARRPQRASPATRARRATPPCSTCGGRHTGRPCPDAVIAGAAAG